MEVDLTPQERAAEEDAEAPLGTRPFVVREAAQKANYDPMKFGLKEWFDRLTLEDPTDKNAKGFDVRLGPRSRKQGIAAIQYEKVCAKVKFHEAKHAVEWLTGDAAVINVRGKKQKSVEVSSGTYWGLFSCNLGVRSIPENRDELSAQDVFKLPIDADDQTLLIGTTGANIPCHQHSEGFDVHLVVQGAERWILFPPNGSHEFTNPPFDLMRTSRLPFELMTVYTRRNIIGAHIPDEALPYVVELRAGDLLYIPAKWWHCFVVPTHATIKYSISISARCNRKLEHGLAHPKPEDNREPNLWSIMDPLQKALSTQFRQAFRAVNKGPPQMNSMDAADEDIFLDEPGSPTQSEALEEFLAAVGIKQPLTIYEVPTLKQLLTQTTPTTPVHSGTPHLLLISQYTWKKPFFTKPFTMQLHNVFDAFAHQSTVDIVNGILHPNIHQQNNV